MMAHPVTLAVIVLDIASLFFLCRTALGAVRVEAHWAPGSSDRRQIRLEALYETGAISARAVLLLMAVSTAVLVLGVTNVFPEIVPGAMCGTGVLQATDGQGGRAFLFRFLTLSLLYVWSAMEGLNRTRPDFPMARLNARILLLISPFAFLAFMDTFEGFTSLDSHGPVDCCTAVYDRVAGNGPSVSMLEGRDGVLVLLFAVLTLLMICFGISGLLCGENRFGRFSGAAAVLSLIWGPVAATALVRVFAAYYYEVLHHHCPWCLFLPEHGFAGFPLFLLLGAAFIEGPTAYSVYLASRKDPEMKTTGIRRAKRALLRMFVFTGCFAVAAVWPALSWRLRFEVWMG